MKNSIFILFIMAFTSPVFSQGGLRLEAKYLPDEGLLLKITPNEYPLFFEGLEKGYTVERKSNGGNFETLKEALRPAAFGVESTSGYRPTATEVMAMRTWSRRDTVRQAIADPDKLAGLNLGLGMYLLSAISTPEDARRSGLVFVDKTAKEGRSYTYRVSVRGQLESAVTLSAVAKIKPPFFVPKMDGVGRDSAAAIRWPHNPRTADYLGYFLEKSVDKTVFDFVNETPIFHNPHIAKGENNPLEPNTIYRKDKLSQNGQPFFYRLIGVDAFGDRVTGQQVLEIIGRDLTPPSAPIDFSIEKNELEGSVILTWKKAEREDDFVGFHVYRSDFPDSTFVRATPQILGATQTTFLEKVPNPENGKFYRIAAVDASGNESFSMEKSVVFNDKTPPAMPLGFQAKVDSGGIVRLQWQPNGEEDFHGYLLTSCRFEEGEFMPVSQKPLRGTTFTDTLALDMENRYFFYQLAALDEMFNVSDFTEKIRVTLPDTIAPTAPVMKEISLEGKSTILEWVTGEEEDLAAVKIFRKEKESWEELATVTVVDITSWSDGAVPAGQKYSYRLQSIDASGNVSKFSNQRSISVRQKEEVPNVSGLRYSVNKDETIQLNWERPLQKETFNFLVFKMENDGNPELLDTLSVVTFTDRKVRSGNAYTYFVVAQDEAGRRSKMSDAVEVKF